MSNKEVRDLMAGVELRVQPPAEGQSGPGTIVGYASVFGPLSGDLGCFRERIAPGAFTRALMKADCRGLVNHDPNMLIGRQKAKTLRLVEDQIGLRYEIDLPDSPLGHNTAESVTRKDLDGSSFSFTTDADEWDYTGDVPIRTVTAVRDLYDVGPVAFPAYEDTSVALRSLETARAAAPAVPEPAPESGPEPVAPPVAEPDDFELTKARLALAEALLPPPLL